jgi:hypothetical protein
LKISSTSKFTRFFSFLIFFCLAWVYESVHGKEKLQESAARANANTQPRKHSAEQSDNSDRKRQKIVDSPPTNLVDTLAALDLKVCSWKTGVYGYWTVILNL